MVFFWVYHSWIKSHFYVFGPNVQFEFNNSNTILDNRRIKSIYFSFFLFSFFYWMPRLNLMNSNTMLDNRTVLDNKGSSTREKSAHESLKVKVEEVFEHPPFGSRFLFATLCSLWIDAALLKILSDLEKRFGLWI